MIRFSGSVDGWLIRRLDPDSNPIDIMDLPKERDEERLLHAMGAEAANVHSLSLLLLATGRGAVSPGHGPK